MGKGQWQQAFCLHVHACDWLGGKMAATRSRRKAGPAYPLTQSQAAGASPQPGAHSRPVNHQRLRPRQQEPHMSCNGQPGQPRAHHITRDALIAMHTGALRSIWMPIERMRVTIRKHGCWRHRDGFEKKKIDYSNGKVVLACVVTSSAARFSGVGCRAVGTTPHGRWGWRWG